MEEEYGQKSTHTAAKIGAIVLLVLIGGIGAYAFQQHSAVGMLKEQRSDVQTQLDDCNKNLGEQKNGRDTCEKAATSASANIASMQGELDDLRHQKEDADKRAELFKSITDKFRKMIDSGKLTVVWRRGRMVVKLRAEVLFPSGSAELSKDGKEALGEVARVLKSVPDRRFEISGHTDSIPLTKDSPFKTNLELSAERAVTVANFLISAGMNASRLSAAGYAEHEPVASNATEAGRQENRRIEIVLLPNLSELPSLGDAGK